MTPLPPAPLRPQFSVFGSGDFMNYAGLGLTLGVSFTNFMGTFGCNISARLAGDSYSPMEMVSVPRAVSVYCAYTHATPTPMPMRMPVLLSPRRHASFTACARCPSAPILQIQLDGLGTALGALLGSPFPTTTYIGHPICAAAAPRPRDTIWRHSLRICARGEREGAHSRCEVLICALHHRCVHRQDHWRHARLLGGERLRVPDHRPRWSVPPRGRTLPFRVIARCSTPCPCPIAPAHTPPPHHLAAIFPWISCMRAPRCKDRVQVLCINPLLERASNPRSLVSIWTGSR